jgi:hypothetical protein
MAPHESHQTHESHQVPGEVSVDAEVPCDLAVGPWTLQVVVNGVASNPVQVQVAQRETLGYPYGFRSFVPPGHFGGWLQTGGDGGDDLGDSLQIGKHNYLTDSNHPAQDSRATQIQNKAEGNACFIAQNFSTGDGVVGIFGESDGCQGSIGVGGSATGWGVAGSASAAAWTR